MAWVGVTQFLKGALTHNAVGSDVIRRLQALREIIHKTVCERGYHQGCSHFVEYYGTDELDASLLLLPIVGFLPIGDPRITSTIAAIERDLIDGGLVRRKPAKHEGVFLVCSCWLADCRAMQGRHDGAQEARLVWQGDDDCGSLLMVATDSYTLGRLAKWLETVPEPVT